MKNVRCLMGRHTWERHVTPGMGGAGAVFHTCSRCGAERPVHEPAKYLSRVIPG